MFGKIILFFRYPFFFYNYKFYVWGRKIEEWIEFYELNYSPDRREKVIKEYLKKCVKLRKRFLKYPLTENEKIYLPKVLGFYEKYQIKHEEIL